MGVVERKQHWETVYATKAENEVSWFQEQPKTSIEIVQRCGAGKDAAIIDVGGGESRLVDRLLDAGYTDITVLDISEHALDVAKRRLGERASKVNWIVADITDWKPQRRYKLWHDRAVFHFLTEPGDRTAYIRALLAALEPGGHAVISTFALDGPEKCSGLPVVRYSAATLAAELGPELRLVAERDEQHRTPWGSIQHFVFCCFERDQS